MIVLSVLIVQASTEEGDLDLLLKETDAALADGNYSKAEELAAKALALDPECVKCNLVMGIALARKGQKSAKSYLLKALSLEPENARTNLELGKYYIYDRDVKAEASDYLEETISLAPTSPYAAEARELLAVLAKGEGPRRYKLAVSVGWQRDSNVALVTDESYLPDEVSHSDDSRWVGTFEAGYTYKFTRDLSGSVGLFYYQNRHNDLYMYDVQSSTLAAGMGYKATDKFSFNLSYSFDYSYVSGVLYSRTHNVSPSFMYFWTPEVMTQLTYKGSRAAYPDSQTYEANSERDGTTHTATLSQLIPITKSNFVRVGYTFEMATANKDYNAYTDHKASLNFISGIPYVEMLATVGGSYSMRNYRGDNPVEGGSRSDRPWQGNVTLSKKFLTYLEAEASFLYVNNNSNLTTYAYKRSVAGISLKARL